jgi:hypothetical protein
MSPIINYKSMFNISNENSEIQYSSFNMEFILQYPVTSAGEEYNDIFQNLWCPYIPVCILILLSHFVIWNALNRANIMASKEPKINKEAAAGTKRHVVLTIPETPEIIRKP